MSHRDPNAKIWHSLGLYVSHEGGDMKRAMMFAIADMRLLADTLNIDWVRVYADATVQYELIRDFGKYQTRKD
jgi:hypothetical protein